MRNRGRKVEGAIRDAGGQRTPPAQVRRGNAGADRRGERAREAEAGRTSGHADPGVLDRVRRADGQRAGARGSVKTPVQLVLDTTAIHAYPSIDVGEIIAILNDDGGRFGVSVVALAVTSALLGDDTVGVLAANAAFSHLDMAGDEWRRLGTV